MASVENRDGCSGSKLKLNLHQENDFVRAALVKTQRRVDMKDKQTQFSLTGPLGDTGMSFGVNFADVDKGDDTDAADGSNPWNVHVARSLGGGASVAFEYIDADTGADDDSETVVQLRVDF